MTMKVSLTQGQVALVDCEDFERVMCTKWMASNQHGHWYAVGRPDGKRLVRLHRYLMGEPQGVEIDHVNGNGLDNRRSNLRVATHQQNQCNQRPRRGNKSSRFKGVSWDSARNAWYAYANANGTRTFLGRFDCEADAASAYDRFVVAAHGEYARTNAS